MAVPKKKVSRSRRNMRRFASGNKLSPVTTVFNEQTQQTVRPHRVVSVAAYNESYKAPESTK